MMMTTIRRCLWAMVLCAIAVPAVAQLYDNGPYITHPNAPHTTLGTANVSQLQNVTLGDTTLGLSVHSAFRLADDFTVPAGQQWKISGVHTYSYSTNFNAGPASSNVRIWSGSPAAGGTVVYDGSAMNGQVSTVFEALRIAESTNAGPPFTDTARRVYDTLIGIPNVILNPGQYWVDWQHAPAAGATTRFNPPKTILGQGNTAAGGQAVQFDGVSAWVAIAQGGSLNPIDLPFKLEGMVVPEPSTMGLFALGLIGLLARRR